MTGQCVGGSSAPKPGSELAVNFTSAAISVALGAYGATWALRAIPFVTALPTFVLSSYCGGDPPAIPTFTQAEADAILNLSFDGDFFSGLGKLSDLIQHVMWYEVCYCTSGTPTVLPPAPPAPSGTGIPTNTPQPINPNCQGLLNSNPVAGGSLPSDGPWSDDHLVDGGYFTTTGLALPLAYLNYPTAVPTSFRITLANTTISGAGRTLRFRWSQTLAYTSGTVPAGAGSTTLAPNTTRQIIVTAVPGNAFLELWVDQNSGSGVTSVEGSMMEAFCGGDQPGGTQSPCCPPDATLQASIDAILAMTTLLQRQLAPFSTIHGAVHSGLSGNGSFAVQGILGLSVTVAAAPARLGVAVGMPDTLWDAGWINLGTADGYGPRMFITSDPFLIQPVPGNVTVVGYSIPDDVTIDVTEIIREP
jgi:hypothetical protein